MEQKYTSYTPEQLKTGEYNPESVAVVIDLFNPDEREALIEVLESKDKEKIYVDFELEKGDIERKIKAVERISAEIDFDIKYVNEKLPQFLSERFEVEKRESPEKKQIMFSDYTSYSSVYDLITFRYLGKFGKEVPPDFFREFSHESVHYQSKSETTVIEQKNGENLILLKKGVSVDSYTRGFDGKEKRNKKTLFTTFINEAITEKINREFLGDVKEKNPEIFDERYGLNNSMAYEKNIKIIDKIISFIAEKEQSSDGKVFDKLAKMTINGEISDFYKIFFSPFDKEEKKKIITLMNMLQDTGNPNDVAYGILFNAINKFLIDKFTEEAKINNKDNN